MTEGESYRASGDLVRQLMQMKTDSEARLEQEQGTLERLRSRAGADLRHMLNVTRPTPLLQTLMNDLAISEVRKVSLNPEFGPEHPEVKRVNGVLAKINSQLDDVVRGIMDTLQLQIEAERSNIRKIAEALDKAQSEDAEMTAKLRPYFQIKRQIEGLSRMHDALQLRITQEKIDAAFASKSQR